MPFSAQNAQNLQRQWQLAEKALQAAPSTRQQPAKPDTMRTAGSHVVIL
jgi:hypothetical protein